jgi:hypothetical protein
VNECDFITESKKEVGTGRILLCHFELAEGDDDEEEED